MDTNRVIPIVLAFLMCAFFSNTLLADDNEHDLFGSVRIGYITVEDDTGNRTDSSAIGGQVGGVSQRWNGFSAGATIYTTQKLFSDDIGDFFGSDGKGYTILGEAFVQTGFSNTFIKAGRFAFDSPHADTDDIRMVPNTFSGIAVSNQDFQDTTLLLTHFDKWAGVDTEKPEDFTDMNGDYGITAIGAIYAGFDNAAIQSWYYHGHDFAGLFYLEAMYELEYLTIGAQFGNQSNKANDHSGPEGNVYGFAASYSINNVILSSAYNDVSGVIVNGFGGGPFFTSAQDHTIEGVEDQSAFALGFEYIGIEGLSLSILSVAFDKGGDEIDYIVRWNIIEDMTFDLIHHDFNEGGSILSASFNYLL